MVLRFPVLLLLLLLIPLLPLDSSIKRVDFEDQRPAAISARELAKIPALKDVSISSSNSDRNFGSEVEIYVMNWRKRVSITPPIIVSASVYTLLDFDIFEYAPPGSEVELAKIYLTLKMPPITSIDVEAHPLTKPFSESTATWSEYYSSFGGTLTTKTVGSSVPPGSFVELDVTDYMRRVVEGRETFNGFFLRTSTYNDTISFYSKEDSDSKKRPYLYVEFRRPSITLTSSYSSVQLKPEDSLEVQLSVGGTYTSRASVSYSWVTAAPGISLSLSRNDAKVPFSSTLKITTSGASPGTYTLKLRASSTISSHYTVSSNEVILTIQVLPESTTVTEQDFSITAYPSSAQTPIGSVTQFSITITPIGGFSGSVSLTASGVPPDSTHQFISSGTNIYLRVSVGRGAPPGDYRIVITGTGGGKSHSTEVTLRVTQLESTETRTPYLRIELSSSSMKLSKGGSASIDVRVLGYLSDPVTITISGLPRGVTESHDLNGVPPNFTSKLTLSASGEAAPGSYQLTIIASGGGISASSKLDLSLIEVESSSQITTSQTASHTASQAQRDFSIEIMPSTLRINKRSSGSVAVTVKWRSGDGNVTLSASGLPSDAKASFNPKSLRSGTSSLIIETGETLGSFTVVVTGTSGNLTRQSTFQLQVTEESRCLIATAAYGSELSPQVNFLREFRDEIVFSTYSGSRFMTVFNSFYYSWSPGVAKLVRESELLAGFVRISLIPLLTILGAGTYICSGNVNEASIIFTGILMSFSIGAVYLGPPFMIISRKFKFLGGPELSKSLIAALMISCVFLAIGISFTFSYVVMLFSSSLVLSSLLLAPNIMMRAFDVLPKYFSEYFGGI